MFVELLLPLAEFLDVPLQVLHCGLHLRHLGLRAGHLVHQLVVLGGRRDMTVSVESQKN